MYGEDKSYSKMDDWEKKSQTDNDLLALTRVAKIKADKARHKRAVAAANAQMKELKAIDSKGSA